ncbi:MAG: hypothetical protein IJI35_16605, partial [Kiritimatiellae bacterium]|nr:hypothetical protein [Kiritimatiellia bacterium]
FPVRPSVFVQEIPPELLVPIRVPGGGYGQSGYGGGYGGGYGRGYGGGYGRSYGGGYGHGYRR